MRRLTGSAAVPTLFALGWALLIAAWVGGNPPFAGADEQWHYARALGVAEGEVVGAPARNQSLGANALQVAWTNQATRAVDIPGGLAPALVGCYIFQPHVAATCLDDQRAPPQRTRFVTPVGTYEPLPYLLPAAVMEAAGTPAAALKLGRVASALPAFALLVLALALLWDGAALSLLGLLLTVTPMVVFSISLLNGSGLEVAAAIGFSAALIRLSRGPSDRARPWAALAVSGAALALSRSASPLWLVLIAALFAGLAGWRASVATVRRGGRAAWVALGVIVAAVVVNRVWEATYGPDLMLGVANARHTIWPAIEQWHHASVDLVGRFGYLETRVPLGLVLLWLGLLLGAIAAAIRLGSRRERWTVAAALAVAVAFPPLFWLVQYRHTGFSLQGRHMLPLIVALPLLVGEVINRHRAAFTWRWAVPVVVAVTAVAQFAGWFVYARRSAVGTGGPAFFLGDADWSPAGGWWPWLVLAALGSLTLVAGAVAARRGDPHLRLLRAPRSSRVAEPRRAGRGRGSSSSDQ